MRNILGDDVAFVRSLEPETKERALRGDGSDGGRTDPRTESERGINSRVVKIPDAAAANSAPLSPILTRTERGIERTLQWPKVTRMERLILPQNEMFVRPSSYQSGQTSAPGSSSQLCSYIHCLVDEDVRLY